MDNTTEAENEGWQREAHCFVVHADISHVDLRFVSNKCLEVLPPCRPNSGTERARPSS